MTLLSLNLIIEKFLFLVFYKTGISQYISSELIGGVWRHTNRTHFPERRPAHLPQRRSRRARRRTSGRHEHIPWHTTGNDRGVQPPLKRRCRAFHAAPNRLLDKVRRQPVQQHAGLPSRYRVCSQHRVQFSHRLHTFRSWSRASSSNDHTSACQPKARNNGRKGHGYRRRG